MFSTHGAGLKSISLPPADVFFVIMFIAKGGKKHENEARPVVKMNKAWQQGRIMHRMFESHLSSTSAYLLLPTVSD